MTIEDIKEYVNTSYAYSFLKDNPHLGANIILLGPGGSYAYGTNNENSDVDIRGCALNTRSEILTGNCFEQVIDNATDTTIYSFNKIIKLLTSCNPNVIEMLGLRDEDYLVKTRFGEMLLANKRLFLSGAAAHSFGGYANQQLYRLNQKAAHELGQKELEEHILKTLSFMRDNFNDKYSVMNDDGIKLYIDQSNRDDFDTEIFMDVNLTHYPVRDYCGMWNELQNTVKQYSKIGKRNKHAIEHDKIGKHMMHLVRLYLMCFDILEKEEIITYRAAEHDLLMSIRNGKYIDDNNQVLPEFFEMVNEYEKRLDYAKENTSLPKKPKIKAINEFVMDINSMVIGVDAW